MSLDPRERFTVTARDYARYRPGYPPALLDHLAAECALDARARVVDLGCGTGISSRFLATRFAVIGVEPNQAMLAEARAAGEGARLRYVRGEAEATGLPDGCAELVAIANALHWFDLQRALAEIARLVVPGGWAVAFWLSRAPAPFNDELEELLRARSPEYRRLFVGEDKDPMGLLRRAGLALRESSLATEQQVDRAGFLGRIASASYVAHGVVDRAGLDAELEALFARHAVDGVLAIPMSCDVQLWRPRGE
jgi:SAM-dependent methyltransferase